MFGVMEHNNEMTTCSEMPTTSGSRRPKRADHQLTDASSDEGSGQRQLGGGLGGLEISLDCGQGRQVHVRGQGRKRGQRPKHEDVLEAAGCLLAGLVRAGRICHDAGLTCE